jgi:hypothetical protein
MILQFLKAIRIQDHVATYLDVRRYKVENVFQRYVIAVPREWAVEIVDATRHPILKPCSRLMEKEVRGGFEIRLVYFVSFHASRLLLSAFVAFVFRICVLSPIEP